VRVYPDADYPPLPLDRLLLDELGLAS